MLLVGPLLNERELETIVVSEQGCVWETTFIHSLNVSGNKVVVARREGSGGIEKLVKGSKRHSLTVTE